MRKRCFAVPQGYTHTLCNKNDKLPASRRSQAIVKLPLKADMLALGNAENKLHSTSIMLRRRNAIKGMPAKHVCVQVGCFEKRRRQATRPLNSISYGNARTQQCTARQAASQSPAQAKRERTIPQPAVASKRFRATAAVQVDEAHTSSHNLSPIRRHLMNIVLKLHSVMEQIEVHVSNLDADVERRRLSLKFCAQVDYIGLGTIHGLWLSLADPLLQAFMEDQRIAAELACCEADVDRHETKFKTLKREWTWLPNIQGPSTESTRVVECWKDLAMAERKYESLQDTAKLHDQKLAMLTSKVEDVLAIVQQYQEDIKNQDMTFSSLYTTRQNLYAVFGAII